MKKKFILAARYYSIEPLGILYLAGLVKAMPDWDCKVVLVREYNFEELYDAVRSWQPDLVGFQIWTGYHIPAFAACDRIRGMGVPVVIGGPHATYFSDECKKHAEWVVQGSGFGLLQKILTGLGGGVHFDKSGREEVFPLPDRDVVYNAYPELGNSPIKSIFGSVGCPMTCTYCYAPSFNEMHGGFKLTVRPVDDIVREAKAIMEQWPLRMVYFQDDIFGYNIRWLEEFSKKWKSEVGVPYHCQIRLELTRHDKGDQRLDLFAEGGCSGITLAIESGNAFLRDRVLFRHMPDELIVEGCRKIMDRGMTLRTEQILAVPFSDTVTDLATLDLNNRIRPTMAWTSILAPYAGTDMGTIAKNFGFYDGNNDDLSESFFDRSVLRHVEGGPRDIEAIVEKSGTPANVHAAKQPLLSLRAHRRNSYDADVVDKTGLKHGTIRYLDQVDNERYCRDTVRLQRLFNWLAMVPQAAKLGRMLVDIPEEEWTWARIGRESEKHLHDTGVGDVESWKRELAREMSVEVLPEPIAQNIPFFAHFPAGGVLARSVVEKDVLRSTRTTGEALDELGTLARRHLFHFGLYKIEEGLAPIASR